MSRKIPIHPAHPERVCWGCDKYCPAGDLACGNGSERSPHPAELFGPDWQEWELAQISEESDDLAQIERKQNGQETA